jgi:hypothetical protein
MTVQDDIRERELCRLFNLQWNPGHQRDGTDAHFNVEINGANVSVPVEVKSTTGDTVSTARDVGMAHIKKWRSRLWVIGFYTKTRNPDIVKTLCLTPDDIEPWVASIEKKILPDFAIANRAARRLDMPDLFEICGEKEYYTIEDAKRLYKQQWSAEQYQTALDLTIEGGRRVISQGGMLSVLKLRSAYIAQRGATLNNPHVTTTFLRSFEETDRMIHEDWAQRIRQIAREYMLANVNHPFGMPEA